MHNPAAVLENDTHPGENSYRTLTYKRITKVLLSARKPDLIIINKKTLLSRLTAE